MSELELIVTFALDTGTVGSIVLSAPELIFIPLSNDTGGNPAQQQRHN